MWSASTWRGSVARIARVGRHPDIDNKSLEFIKGEVGKETVTIRPEKVANFVTEEKIIKPGVESMEKSEDNYKVEFPKEIRTGDQWCGGISIGAERSGNTVPEGEKNEYVMTGAEGHCETEKADVLVTGAEGGCDTEKADVLVTETEGGCETEKDDVIVTVGDTEQDDERDGDTEQAGTKW